MSSGLGGSEYWVLVGESRGCVLFGGILGGSSVEEVSGFICFACFCLPGGLCFRVVFSLCFSFFVLGLSVDFDH
jgi:hypothetical protein